MSLVSRGILGVAGAMAALALAPQSAAAGTVIAISGPSAEQYPVGTRIDDTQRITLRTGDRMTVLNDGQTRVLRGPGTFILAQRGGQAGNRTLTALTSRRGAARARTGAVRTGEGALPPTNPNIYYVDVATAGTICLPNADPIRLWRADTSAEMSYSIARVGDAMDAVRVTFPAGEMLAQWEDALQVREGETYAITMTGSETSVNVQFKFLQDIPDDVEELALTLIENGCEVQLAQMAALG